MAPPVKQGAESQTRWLLRLINEQGEFIDGLIEQRRALRLVVRKWEIAFALVCAQFFAVAVAAVWGWAR